MSEKIPNIFNYATSELSQDAFLCWLAEWARPQLKEVDTALQELGTRFLKKCFQLTGRPDIEITSVDIPQKQVNDLDVFIRVNDEYAVMIEDKTYTREHSEQLTRYKNAFIGEFPDEKQVRIYFKTDEQSDMSQVIKAGYSIFTREEMLSILEPYANRLAPELHKHSLVVSYWHNLKWLHSRILSFNFERRWDSNAWKGFFQNIQKRFLEIGIWSGWGYIANPSGGYMGFYFGFEDQTQNSHVSIDAKDGNGTRLCYKIMVPEKQLRSTLRLQWHNKLVAAGNEFKIRIDKPDRFGNGKHMAVAEWRNGSDKEGKEFRVFNDDGTVNMDKTFDNLKLALDVLTKAREMI